MLALVPLVLSAATAGAAAPQPEVGLGNGQIGDYQWAVAVKRPQALPNSAGQGARQPCLMVGTTWQLGPFSYRRSKSRQCASSSGLSASGAPLIARGVQPSTGAPARMTAVGVVVAPAVSRIEVTLANGVKRTIHLERLSSAAARRAGLERFRYFAFAARGEWCAQRLVTESASGRALWDSGTDTYGCGSNSRPPRFAG